MLAVVVSILAGLGGAFALWQAWLRWRAYGTAQARTLVAEARTTFSDITARGGLDRSEFQAGDRQTVEERLQDLRGQLHDHVLQDRLDHLLAHVRSAWASAPPKWSGAAGGATGSSTRFADSPERRAAVYHMQTQRQVEAARDGLVEIDSVLDRCNQLDGPIVRP